MAYSESLARRVRDAFPPGLAVEEKRMFGGLTFLVDGRMRCGIVGDRLMIRLPPADCERALAQPHVRPMDLTGRPMRGFLFIEPAGLRSSASLKRWVESAVTSSAIPVVSPSARGS